MDYFDEIFFDMDIFQKNFFEKIRREMDAINNAVKTGELKGNWDVKEISEPNMRGYIIYGHYDADLPTEIKSPLESSRPHPIKPKRPLRPEPSLTEVREPLSDVYEDKEFVKVCVELPGVEKNDIQLNVSNGKAEIKAKKFYKILDLPTNNVDPEKIKASYKNGVLEATIPKKKLKKSDKKKIKIV
jgi:HSP20 family molecular chaperone IbpA